MNEKINNVGGSKTFHVEAKHVDLKTWEHCQAMEVPKLLYVVTQTNQIHNLY